MSKSLANLRWHLRNLRGVFELCDDVVSDIYGNALVLIYHKGKFDSRFLHICRTSSKCFRVYHYGEYKTFRTAVSACEYIENIIRSYRGVK